MTTYQSFNPDQGITIRQDLPLNLTNNLATSSPAIKRIIVHNNMSVLPDVSDNKSDCGAGCLPVSRWLVKPLLAGIC